MTNTNCLADMHCPDCKSEGPFEIYGAALFTVHDDGIAEYREAE